MEKKLRNYIRKTLLENYGMDHLFDDDEAFQAFKGELNSEMGEFTPPKDEEVDAIKAELARLNLNLPSDEEELKKIEAGVIAKLPHLEAEMLKNRMEKLFGKGSYNE